MADACLDGVKRTFGKRVGSHQKGHRILVLTRQRRVHIPRAERDDPDTERPAFAAQAFAVTDHRRLARTIGAMPRQPPDAGNAGDPDQRATPAFAKVTQERLEGRGQAQVVGLVGGPHHRQIVEFGRVHADADACVGDDDIRQPLTGDALASGSGDAVDVAHIGGIRHACRWVEPPRLRPGRDLRGATCHQRQPVSGLLVTLGEGPSDSARCAGDVHER